MCASDQMLPMSQTPTLQTIRAKKDALLASAARYDAMAQKARAEAADYEAAERVWLKMSPHEDHERSEQERVADKILNEVVTVVRKPANTPPVPEMIIEELRAAGPQGKTAAELLELIQKAYWPDATSSDVGSTAWRMWKDGRLVRPQTGRYALPPPQITANTDPDPLFADQDS
jgi:hypothetical protein